MDPKMIEAVDSFLAATGVKTEGDSKKAEAEEEGNNEAPQKFYCDVCEITCASETTYESHVNGSKHTKALRLKQSLGPNFLMRGKRGECILTRRLETVAIGPVIGLQFLTEFQPVTENPSVMNVWYFCDLCKCKLDSATVMTHTIGNRHRTTYVRKKHPDMLQTVDTANRVEQTKISTELARKVEQKEGRQLPKVSVDNGKSTLEAMDSKIVKDKMAAKTHRLNKIFTDTIPSYKSAVFEKQVNSIGQPVIGLEHITEFQPNDHSERSIYTYYCDLCDVTLDTSTIRTHIVGNKHRKGYILANHLDMMMGCDEDDKVAYKSKLLECVTKIAAKGHQPIKVRVSKIVEPVSRKRSLQDSFVAPGANSAKRPAPLMSQNARPPMMRRAPASRMLSPGPLISSKPMGPPLSGPPLRSARSAAPAASGLDARRAPRPMGLAVSMDRLLHLLDSTPLSTEEEAELALELSNRLTQELLDYRKNSVPVHMFEKARRSSGLEDSLTSQKHQPLPSGRQSLTSISSSYDPSYDTSYDPPYEQANYQEEYQGAYSSYNETPDPAPSNYSSYESNYTSNDSYGQQDYNDSYSYKHDSYLPYSGSSSISLSQLPKIGGNGLW